MPFVAVALALAAAVLHATWNLILARAPDTQAATAFALLVGSVAFLPVGIATWDVDRAAYPYLAASVALELAYVVLLAAAYDRAELTTVYPIARGSAPVLVLIGAAALGASVTVLQGAGVVLVGVGVVALRGLGAGARTRDGLLGLAVGVTIASYTVVDDHGLDHAAALPYLEVVVGTSSAVYAAAIWRRRGSAAVRRAGSVPVAVAGLCVFGAYGLTLAALARAPAAPVAAIRETSVLMAVVVAGVALHEPVGPRRLAGAALVVGGVALVATG